VSKFVPEAEVASLNEMLRTADEEELWQWFTKQLYIGFAEARKGKLKTVNVQKFEEDRDCNITELAQRILVQKYKPSRGMAFIINNPVPREIFAASFSDRIVHHFLIRQIGDFWEKRLLPRSFSCREGKGTLYGVRRLESDLRKASRNWTRKIWVMKIDFQGYFMSLPRDYLYKRVMWGLNRQFPNGGPVYDICKYLWGRVLFDNPTDGVRIKGRTSNWDILPHSKSLFYAPEGRGIVIGNLTSQWVSNMALDPLDRFVKFELGCKYYGRYVDDAYFIADTKEELLVMREKVTKFATDMGLTIHPKKHYLQLAHRGVSFLGVVIYPGRTVVATRFKKNLRRLKYRIDKEGVSQKNLTSLVAFKGLAQHYKHQKTFRDIYGEGIFSEMKRWQDLA
jgi:hypothetical protein